MISENCQRVLKVCDELVKSTSNHHDEKEYDFKVDDLYICEAKDHVKSCIDAGLKLWNKLDPNSHLQQITIANKRLPPSSVLPIGFDILQSVEDDVNGCSIKSNVKFQHIFKSILQFQESLDMVSNSGLKSAWFKQNHSRIALGESVFTKRRNYLPAQKILSLKDNEGGLKERRIPLLTIAYLMSGVNGNSTHEYEVLAENTLTSIIDVLTCPVADLRDKKAIENSFFVIDHDVYMLHLETDPGDFSQNMEKWIQHKLSGVSADTFQLTKYWSFHEMKGKTFSDLKLCVGLDFFYQHTQGCVHRLSLADIQFITKNMADNVDYPQLSFMTKRFAQRCNICEVKVASYKCFGDELADREPMFYCSDCYHMQHYTADGNLCERPSLRVYPCT